MTQLNVSDEALKERLNEGTQKKKEHLTKQTKTKAPVGLYKLAVVNYELTSFTTEKYGEVQKIILYINMKDKNERQKYYDIREEFAFFVFNNKDGSTACPAFDQLLQFCKDAYGETPTFNSGDILDVVDGFKNLFEQKKELPFQAIIIHKEEVYKDRIIKMALVYRHSVVKDGASTEKLKKVAESMNKEWKLSPEKKKELIQKSKAKARKNSDQEVNEPDVPDSVQAEESGYEEQSGYAPEEDDLPF